MKELSIVIPVYNSEKTIGKVIEQLRKEINDLINYEIILVDDESEDESIEVIKKYLGKNSNIKLIELARNFGQHNALMAGIKQTCAKYILCMDDDLQTDPKYVLEMYKKIKKSGYDVVYAKYNNYKANRFRKFVSKINNQMATSLTEKPKDLYVTSFFIMKKFIADEISKYQGPYPFISGLILRITKKITIIEVEHKLRTEGKSNYNLYKLIKLWANAFTSFSVKPLRMSAIFGAFLALLGFIYICFITYLKITNPETMIGWTSTVAIIIFLGGIQLLSIGLIGEYVGRIFLLLNKKPQYVIRRENKNNDEK